jgi:hypothetical protein
MDLSVSSPGGCNGNGELGDKDQLRPFPTSQ